MKDSDLLQIVLLRAGNPAPLESALQALKRHLPEREARATLERWLISGLVSIGEPTGAGGFSVVLPEAARWEKTGA